MLEATQSSVNKPTTRQCAAGAITDPTIAIFLFDSTILILLKFFHLINVVFFRTCAEVSKS